MRSSYHSVLEATVRSFLAVAFYSNPIQTTMGLPMCYVERCNSSFETDLSFCDPIVV